MASINIGWRTNVTEAMRVVDGSTVYQIKGVLPDVGGRQFVDLSCEVVS
jgi:head-tail adaptor